MDDLALPRSRDEITTLQEQLKARALEQARRAPFYRERLKGVRHWRDIPLLEKEALRALSPGEFYSEFCLGPREDWRELWRSGGTTGTPLFYPRTAEDLHWAMIGFRRVYHCVGAGAGDVAHLSLPLGIHPAGQMMARAGELQGIAMAWVGAGAAAPSELQLDLLALFKPTLWIGMSSYGIHLSNLARTKDIDLKTIGVRKIITTAEPLSRAKRETLGREWNARVFDSFGMTECMMMGAEDPADGEAAVGFRTWSDLVHLEVLDPKTLEPVPEGHEGVLVVTPLRTNHATPFLRWNTGDIVALTDRPESGRPGSGPYGVFPLLRHAHRTAGFFKVRGVNIGHGALEDHMFALREVADFRCEVVNDGGLDQLVLIVELRGECDLEKSIKNTFEVTPVVRAVAPGTIAREFESAVKAPRFLDRR